MFAGLSYCCLILAVAANPRYVNNYYLLCFHCQNTFTIHILSYTPFKCIVMDSLGYGCRQSNRKLVPPQKLTNDLGYEGETSRKNKTQKTGGLAPDPKCNNAKIPSVNYVVKHVVKIFAGELGGGDTIYIGTVKKNRQNWGGGGGCSFSI